VRKRSLVVVVAVLAALSAALPVSAAPLAALKPKIDPAVVTHLKSQASTDVVIGFRSAPTNADIAALRVAGFRGPFERYSIVPAVAATATPASIAAIGKSTRVASVQDDAVLPYTLDRATAVGRVRPIWDATYRLGGTDHLGGFTGQGVTVAVVDSGIDGRHPDLREKTLADALGEETVTKANFVMAGRTNGNDVANLLAPNSGFGENGNIDNIIEANATAIPVINSDNGGHGTHVAGIVAGRGTASGGKYVGVAPSAELVGISGGEVLSVARALAAFDWIHLHHAEYGIRIVSNSWGGGASADIPDFLIRNAAERLVNEDGLVVVFAAGNNGGDGTAVQTVFNSNSPSVISVANYYDRTGNVDGSSSRGLKTDPNTWPDLAAPGTQIISTAMVGGAVTYYGTTQDGLISAIDPHGDPLVVSVPTPTTTETSAGGFDVVAGDYASFTGTSMAAPFVSGVIALLLEANAALTPAQIRTILRSTANVAPNLPADYEYAMGTGVVDAAEAIAVALRMRDGDTLSEALSSASLDLDVLPAQINMGTGPVTDNVVPLLPGLPPVITASGNMYAANAVNPFGPAGVPPVFVGGEPVGLAARFIHSNSSSVPLTAGGFTVTFTILKDNVAVAAPFDGVIGADEADWQANYEWTVPADYSGNYVLAGNIVVGSSNYHLFDYPFSVAP